MKLWWDVLDIDKFKRAMDQMSSSNSGDAEPEVVQWYIEALMPCILEKHKAFPDIESNF